MMAYFEGEYSTVQELIRYCHTLDRPDKKLQICMNICQMLEAVEMNEDLRKEIDKMRKFAQDLLTNTKFRKAIYKRDALMNIEPVTYFGDDVPKGDMYDYDMELEEDVTVIDFKIVTFLGNVLKFMQADAII
jgi:hypothetical protein